MVQVSPSKTSSKALPLNTSLSISKATPAAPSKVFKSPPQNIYGYAVSTWAVKRVSSSRSIFNTVLLLVINVFVQGVIVYYIGKHSIDTATPECSEIKDEFNDLLTVACLFIFAASQIGGCTCIETGQMIAKAQEIQVPATSSAVSGPEPIRKTSCCVRIALFMAITMSELVIWLMIMIAGGMFLVKSRDVSSLILNTLALDFITQVDEHLFTTMLNKATQQRVIKYKIEHSLGIEEGDSTDKAVESRGRLVKCLNDGTFFMPLVVLVYSLLAIFVVRKGGEPC